MRLGREGATSGEDRTPRLAPGCDPSQLSLTPAEGYLLSRIDGRTPLSLLRQIGGMPPGEIDRCIERLSKEGVLAFDASGRERPRAASAASAAPAAPPTAATRAVAAPEIDPALDLAVDVQERVLEFEARLARPYHEILGVAADADVRAIKQAYFGLSKQFHPDRYFRRNLGPFGPRIERIFKKVLEAYELLSDPATRAEVQNAQAASAAPEPAAAPSQGAAAARRLRARLGALGKHHRAHDERKRKAKSLFESGMAAFHAERWIEAAGSVRLAIAFDPENEAFKGAFSDVQRRAHEERARVLMKEADGASSLGDWREAARLYEEALHYRAFDASLNEKTARLLLKLSGDLRKAKEYALAACELEPDTAAYRRTLGQVYRAAGLAANAKREFQNALRLDPSDAESKQELKSL
ncbi:MAG TPA: DnaJ domain-containing protein [Myxococcota bacterium]|nr:DnaJ domain-containing protein [Myxococcota bacterium]